MKCVLLAGGFGTRLSEETTTKPKPMVEIGGRPILWHIMKMYSQHGVNEFIICAGYKGYVIKEYFANYFLHMSNITFDMSTNEMQVHENKAEPWKVTIVDTGDGTMTGGRLLRVKEYIGDETFCFTYGDGVSNVDITKLIEFHKKKDKWATVTAVQPPGRFGAIKMDDTTITSFEEKPQGDGGYINGGFFVLEPDVFDLIDGDSMIWEREPMERLAEKRQIEAYKHDGFWRPMDTLRDKNHLEDLWESNKAPWKTW
ncbi:glucose-1-phosphate cytidylyltransferase [Rhodohalobacter halophilus]|uniref:glucose-1-phosphate cytidylyltransferase n=1 Tax=Rhodohalobacter halophilus TaxID=1812810 RepID=UPI00083F8D36|nr:glucose-1-phosphate cytidylyltransferase [Rhodohalobacter halophilus]